MRSAHPPRREGDRRDGPSRRRSSRQEEVDVYYPPEIACTPARSKPNACMWLCTRARPGNLPPTDRCEVAREHKPYRSAASLRAWSAKTRGLLRDLEENLRKPLPDVLAMLPGPHKPQAYKACRRAGKTEGRPPQHDENDPKEVGGGTSPRKRVHTCTPCMLARERRSTERKDLEKQRR